MPITSSREPVKSRRLSGFMSRTEEQSGRWNRRELVFST